MATNPEPAGESKALVKAVRLLDAVAARGPRGVSQLARELALPKATVHRLLRTLLDAGLVVEQSTGYDLGPHCIVLGGAYLQRLDLRVAFRDELAELSRQTGETVHLGVREDDRVVYVDKVDGPHAVGMRSRIGSTARLHSSGLGKALLTWSGEDVREAVIAGGLPARTPATIVDAAQLRAEFARVAERGWSIDDVENEDGIRCVAAPVIDHEGAAVAAISIAGPSYRITRERAEALGPVAAAAADVLSARLGRARAAASSDTGPAPPIARTAHDGGTDEVGAPASIPAAAHDLIDGATHAALATILPDGAPQLTPVWVERDGDVLVFNTAAGRLKTRNMQRDPRATVVVVDPDDPEVYLQVRGRVELTDDVGGAHNAELHERHGQPLSEHGRRDRVIVRLTPERVQLRLGPG